MAESDLVLAFDDGEGGEDVGGVVAVEVVEVEVEGVGVGSEVAAGSAELPCGLLQIHFRASAIGAMSASGMASSRMRRYMSAPNPWILA